MYKASLKQISGLLMFFRTKTSSNIDENSFFYGYFIEINLFLLHIEMCTKY